MATTTLILGRWQFVLALFGAAGLLLGCHSQSEPLDVHKIAGRELPPARAALQDDKVKTAEGRGVQLQDGLDAEEAVAIALAHNPRVRAERRRQQVAEAEVSAVSQIPNPEVGVELLHLQHPEQKSWGVSLDWSPPQPAEYAARKAQANARVEEVRQDIAEREWELATEVRLAHAMASEYEAQRAPTQRSIELRRRMIEAIRLRVEQGASTQVQLNLAMVSLARAEQELENIELARGAAVRTLIGLLGVMPDDSIKLQDGKSAGWPDDEASIPDPRDMASRALDNRPKLKAAAARYDQLTHALNAERARRWPWIQRVTLPRYRQNYYSKDTHDVAVQLDVSVPIFNLNGGRIAVAEAARDREHDALIASVETLRRDVALTCAELKDRKRALQRFRDVIMPSVEQGEAMLERAYEGQQADITTVLAGQDATFRIRREYVDARLQYRRSWLALARLVGASPSSLLRSRQ